jgi:NitT/TauT family transport system substrate-binding protein
MRTRRHIVIIGAAICVTAGLMGATHAEPLRISYFIWVGNGPFFVAQEKGLFAKEGVEVELINVEDHTTAFAGLFIGQVDAAEMPWRRPRPTGR